MSLLLYSCRKHEKLTEIVKMEPPIDVKGIQSMVHGADVCSNYYLAPRYHALCKSSCWTKGHWLYK